MKIHLLLLFGLLVTVDAVSAAEYKIANDKENLVKFISNAPIEDFEGVTKNIEGIVSWQGDNPVDSSAFSLKVDLRTLDTGIEMRNRHMRDNYLETDKYPYAVYEGKLVQAEKNKEGGFFEVVVEGIMEIHGKQNPLTVSGTVNGTGDLYEITCQAEIKLGDFDIKIPQLLIMKISEVIKLELNFYISKAVPEP